MGGDPAYPPGGEDPPLPPLPIGAGGLKVARAHSRLGWHWWPEPNSILSAPYDGRRPCVQRGTCQQGCSEGAKASTDLTHWPKAIGHGAQLVTGARVRRLETNAKGLVTGATWLDKRGQGALHAGQGDRAGGQRDRHSPPAAALRRRSPPRRPGQLVRSRGPAADDASLRQRRRPVRRAATELAGPVRLLDRVVRVLRDRREAWLPARRQVGPRANVRPDQRGTPQPRRHAGVGPRTPPPRAQPPGPRRQLGPLRRGPARRGEPHRALEDAQGLVRHSGARGPLQGGRQLAPAARLPHREGDRIVDGGGRAHGRGRPPDALFRLAPAGHGAHGQTIRRRPYSTVGTAPTTCPTCTSSTARASSRPPA